MGNGRSGNATRGENAAFHRFPIPDSRFPVFQRIPAPSSPLLRDAQDFLDGGLAGQCLHQAILVHGAHAVGARIVDPRPFAAPEIARVYAQYPHIGPVLPAVGYSTQQLAALRDTINSSDAEVIVSATPADLAALITLSKPVLRARYEFEETGEPRLGDLVEAFLRERGLAG